MPLNCYTRQRKNGTNYVSCENKKDLKTEKKNISNNKMPPRKKDSTKNPGTPAHYWNQEQIRIGQNIKSTIPESLVGELFGQDTGTGGKKQRKNLIGVRKIPILEGHAKNINSSILDSHIQEWHKSYATYKKMKVEYNKGDTTAPSVVAGGKAHDNFKAMYEARQKAPAKNLYTLARKAPTTKPTTKPPPKKKVAVSYRVGSGPMKKSTAIVNKTGPRSGGTTVGTVVKTKKAPTRARARKATGPVKNAKTAPQKVARFDLITGRTNEVYKALGPALGIPKYGNKVTPGKVMLKRNIRKGAIFV